MGVGCRFLGLSSLPSARPGPGRPAPQWAGLGNNSSVPILSARPKGQPAFGGRNTAGPRISASWQPGSLASEPGRRSSLRPELMVVAMLARSARPAHDPASRHYEGQQDNYPQEPRAATCPADHQDHEGTKGDREPERQDYVAAAARNLYWPWNAMLGQRLVGARPTRPGIRKLTEIGSRQVRHQGVKHAEGLRRVGLVQPLLELLESESAGRIMPAQGGGSPIPVLVGGASPRITGHQASIHWARACQDRQAR